MIVIDTPILIPIKAFLTTAMLSKLSKNNDMIYIHTKEGNTTPKVPTKAPFKPNFLYPIQVDILIAIGPGDDSAIARISKNSDSDSQALFSTNFSFISGIIT